MLIGQRLKRRREERGLTQSQAAESLKIPLRTYQLWESGRSDRVLARAFDLARFLAADTDTDTNQENASG